MPELPSPGAKKSTVVWLLGLSGAGKTTLARALTEEARAAGIRALHLDADDLRAQFWPELGHSDSDRAKNLARIALLASLSTDVAEIVFVSAITPRESHRTTARQLVSQCARYFEVYVATPLAQCAARDPKGLYARAFLGEIPEFTGVSSPFEPPVAPDLIADGGAAAVDLLARDVVSFLRERRAWPRASNGDMTRPHQRRLAHT